VRGWLPVLLLIPWLMAACGGDDDQRDPRRDTADPDVPVDVAEVHDATPDPGVDPGTPDPGTSDPGQPEAEVTPAAPVRFVGDTDALVATFELIDGAATSVDVAQFEANDDPIVDEVLRSLAKARGRGCSVRVLLDDEIDENQLAVDTLTGSYDVDAALDDSDRRVHLKSLLADGQRLMLGSTNWSDVSFKYSHEANLVLTDPTLGAALGAFVAELWSDTSTLHDRPRASGVHATLAFNADIGALVRERIQAAKTRIHGVFYVISDQSAEVDAVLDELEAAAKRGVDVVLILERSDWDWNLNNLNKDVAKRLIPKGVTVLADPVEEQTHAKTLIADDELVVLTGNLSYASLTGDHNVGVRTAWPQAVADAEAWFAALRSKSSTHPH